MKYNKVVIGIDQSYARTGVSVYADGKKIYIKSIELKRLKSNSERRRVLREKLGSLLTGVSGKSKKTICVIERIRLSSQGFINIDYIKSIGALNALIVDVFGEAGIQVYSVDTRAWKSKVLGSSKPKKNKFNVQPEKWLMIKYLIDKGFEEDVLLEVKGRKEKNTHIRADGKKYEYNDDAADSAGIAIFGFIGDKSKFKLEK